MPKCTEMEGCVLKPLPLMVKGVDPVTSPAVGKMLEIEKAETARRSIRIRRAMAVNGAVEEEGHESVCDTVRLEMLSSAALFPSSLPFRTLHML